MLPVGANEIGDLVAKLGGRSRKSVESAMGQLAMQGSRAVDALIEALEGDGAGVRVRAMQLLALIQDPRSREPLAAMLLDPDPRMRASAARALDSFPHPHSVSALIRVLERDPSERVKIAAIQALIALHAAGQDTAVAPVLAALTDPARSKRVRLAALDLLPLLPAAQQRGLVERLEHDRQAELTRAAKELCAREGCQGDGGTTRSWIERLGSKNYAEWREAVRRLGSRREALEPLLEEMRTRAHDPELCKRAGMALRAMGPRRAPSIAARLDDLEDPLPMLVLVEVIGVLGDRSSIYRLKGLIERLEARRSGTVDGFDGLQRVEARAHLELARIGSRVASDSLRLALRDSGRRVEPELVTAAALVGQQEEIGPLLDAWQREDGPERDWIGQAVRTIMKRERLRRNNRLFATMTATRQACLRSILGGPAPGRADGRVDGLAQP